MYKTRHLLGVISLFFLLFFSTETFAGNGCGYLKFYGRGGSTTGSYARTDTGASFTFQFSRFTIETWLLPEDTINEQALLLNGSCDIACPSIYLGIGNTDPTCKGTTTTRNRFAFGMVNSNGTFFQLKQGTKFKANEWVHVAVSYDGSMIRMFINGIQEDSTAATGIPELSRMNYLMVGSEPGLNCGGVGGRFSYTGAMDELRIWDTARTGAEILDNMNTYLPDTQPKLRAYFHFNDDLSGKTAYSSVSNDKIALHSTTAYLQGGRFPDYGAPSLLVQPKSLNLCGSIAGKFFASPKNNGYPVQYQWQYMVGGNAFDLSDTGGYSGSKTDTLSISNGSATLKYRLKISGPCDTKIAFSDTFTFYNEPLPVITLADSLAFCAGDTLTIVPAVTGNGPFDYKWSNGGLKDSLRVSAPGLYSITATSNQGCKSTDSIMVIKNELPTILINGQSFVKPGTKVILKATGAQAYNWTTGGTADSIEVTPLTTTTYGVLGTNDKGCQNTDTITIFMDTVGLNIYKNQLATVKIYPNPVTKVITLNFSNQSGLTMIKIISIDGREVMNLPIKQNAETLSLDVSGLPPGAYSAQFISDIGVQTARFIKQ